MARRTKSVCLVNVEAIVRWVSKSCNLRDCEWFLMIRIYLDDLFIRIRWLIFEQMRPFGIHWCYRYSAKKIRKCIRTISLELMELQEYVLSRRNDPLMGESRPSGETGTIRFWLKNRNSAKYLYLSILLYYILSKCSFLKKTRSIFIISLLSHIFSINLFFSFNFVEK